MRGNSRFQRLFGSIYPLHLQYLPTPPHVLVQTQFQFEQLKFIPKYSGIKRRQKGRMPVNGSSGWPNLCWKCASVYNRHSQVCLASSPSRQQTIISLEVYELWVLRAILKAAQPAMSANKNCCPWNAAPPACISSPCFFCVVLPAVAFAAGQTSSNPVFSISLRFPQLLSHFLTGLPSASSIYWVASWPLGTGGLECLTLSAANAFCISD